MNRSNIRTFIAIVFPASISCIVRSVINQLSVIKGQVGWVKDHSVHLTLKFLGEISPDKLEQVKQALAVSVSDVSPFNLHLTELGVFPNNRQPRIIWWGIKSDTPQLLHIYQNIEKEMNVCGFALENRPFSPHITLGRVRELNQPQQLIKLMSKIELPTHEPIQINQVELIQSNLGKEGATYTPLASFNFTINY